MSRCVTAVAFGAAYTLPPKTPPPYPTPRLSQILPVSRPSAHMAPWLLEEEMEILAELDAVRARLAVGGFEFECFERHEADLSSRLDDVRDVHRKFERKIIGFEIYAEKPPPMITTEDGFDAGPELS